MVGLFFNKNKEQRNLGDGKVIAFINQKGGVGKTTMAFNTAAALTKANKKVLCLDLDPQSNLSLLLGSNQSGEDSYGLFQLLINSIRELRTLHRPVLLSEEIKTNDGIDFLAGNQELSGFELTVAGINAPRQLILKKFIEQNDLLNLYDYIIVDCPPTLGLLVVNILCASHGVIIPFRPDEFSKKGLGNFYQVLDDIQDMGVAEAPKVLTHIPNLVDLRRKQEVNDLEEITKDLIEAFGQAHISRPFFNRAQLVKSQAQKKSVFAYSAKEFGPLQGQFKAIADLIMESAQ